MNAMHEKSVFFFLLLSRLWIFESKSNLELLSIRKISSVVMENQN